MRVIFADDIADHPRAFLVSAGWVQLQEPHRPEQAAVHRLQPVAQVRQRPRCNRRKRINKIAFRKRCIEGSLNNLVERICKVTRSAEPTSELPSLMRSSY